MVGWHHRLDGHEIEHTPRDGEAWRAAVHGVAKSRTSEQLTLHFLVNLVDLLRCFQTSNAQFYCV